MSLSKNTCIRLGVGICVIVGVLLVVKSQRDAAFERKYRPRMAEKFDGAENLDIISSTTRIEASRIGELPKDHLYTNGHGYQAPLGNYTMQSGPTPVSPELQGRILNTLLSPTSYEWDPQWVKACCFAPGVRLRLISGNESRDILFCFGCADFAVFKNGRPVAWNDFHLARRQLANIFKALYPNDAEIQAL